MGEQKTCYATSLRKYFAAKTKVCSGLLSTEARYKMTREMTLCFFSSMYRFHPELENSHTHKHMYNVHEHKHAESCKQIRGIRRNTNMNLMHKSWDVENERLKRSKIFLSLSPFFFFCTSLWGHWKRSWNKSVSICRLPNSPLGCTKCVYYALA